MKIVPNHVYPRGTRDISVASLSNHSISCGSVVPSFSLCWNIPTKSQQQGMSSSEANELVATSGSQKKIWISWKDKSKELIDEKRKESQYKQT